MMWASSGMYCSIRIAAVDPIFFQSLSPIKTPEQVIQKLLPYVEDRLTAGDRLQAIARHILGLFKGRPGARAFRRHLSENATKEYAGPEVIAAAAAMVYPLRESPVA